ncbi:MAG: hypothetical protein WB384_06020 [Candidatus Sulfotelmatobacter sp.]
MRFAETKLRGTAEHCSLRGIAAGVFVFMVLATSPWSFAQGEPPHLAVLQGQLLSTSADCPVVRVHGKGQPLTGYTTYVYHTLQDKRLANREVRLEGTMKADGTFEVERLYTVKDGKLYRVRYFCKVCNIEALEPGNCVCCQQPTELQEIPVSNR